MKLIYTVHLVVGIAAFGLVLAITVYEYLQERSKEAPAL